VAGDGAHAAIFVFAEAGPEDDHASESGPAAHGVDHGGAGEVAEVCEGEPAAAPDPVTGDRVHEGHE